jgi:ubiquinone biosynthesis protein COQ4
VRAIRALIRDPDDTKLVFDVIGALSGRSGERLFARFEATEVGACLLAERPDLLARLSDRDALLALPVGTLGRTYAEFMGREQISADGLVDASLEGGSGPDPELSPERQWFGMRLRDMHDLWHVASGYNRDLVGEASLLAFTYAQTRNRGIGLIVAAAWWRAGREHPEVRPIIRDGYRRGKRAEWLPGQDWEALLERPLEEVRAKLGLGEPPTYPELRSEGAPVLSAS